MASQNSQPLSPSSRSAALLVARLVFYNGLLMGVGMCVMAVAVVFFQVGGVATAAERWQVGGVLLVLALLAFGFVALARTRIAKLKLGGA